MSLVYDDELIKNYILCCNIDDTINRPNSRYSVLEFSKYIAKKEFKFNNIELSYIDRFWNCIYNNKWLYLSKEMIVYDFGYDYDIILNNPKIDIDVEYLNNFYNRILINFCLKNIEYRQVDEKYITNAIKNNSSKDILRKLPSYIDGNRHFIISSDCYKFLTILVDTDKARESKRNYSKVEELASITYKIICDIKIKLEQEKIDKVFENLKIIEEKTRERERYNKTLRDLNIFKKESHKLNHKKEDEIQRKRKPKRSTVKYWKKKMLDIIN